MRGTSGSAVCCGSKVVRGVWSAAQVCLELWRIPDPDSPLVSPSCPQPGHPGRPEKTKSDGEKKRRFFNPTQDCKATSYDTESSFFTSETALGKNNVTFPELSIMMIFHEDTDLKISIFSEQHLK